MRIGKFEPRHRILMAKYLVNYWKSRGMHQFSIRYATNYLKNGLTFEMKTERFVAKDNNGNVIGTIALLKYAEHVAEIRDEIWENETIGSSLLEHIIGYAKKKRIRKLYSLSIKDKVKFYSAHGFKKEGFLKDQFKKGEHITIMSKFV